MSDDLALSAVEERSAALRNKGLAKEVLDRLETDERFFTWKPHAKQLEILLSKQRITAGVGANRVGKSDVLCYIAAAQLQGWNPALTRHFGKFVHYGRRRKRIWVVSLDTNVSRDVAEEKVRSFLPDSEGCEWHESDKTWEHPETHSLLTFKSCESGRQKFQGADVDLILFDEEPPEDIFSECYARTIDRSGRIYFSFTPLLGSVWLHNMLFNRPDIGTLVVGMGMVDNPHIPPAEIEIAKKQWSGDELRIRVYGEYILRIGSPFFDREDLDWQADRCIAPKNIWRGVIAQGRNLVTQRVAAADGKLEIYRDRKGKRMYALGVDVSSGDAVQVGDYSCIQVVDCKTFEQVACWHGRADPGVVGEEAVKLARYYNDALIAPEVNSVGLATLLAIEREGYGNVFMRIQHDKTASGVKSVPRSGWVTDRRTKPAALNGLKDALRDRLVFLNDRHTIDELRRFGFLREGCPANLFGLGAISGHDDRVMALAIALQGAYQVGMPLAGSKDEPETLFEVLANDAELNGSPSDVVEDVWGADDDSDFF